MFPLTEQIHIVIGYAWLIAALLLLILEAGTPGLFFFISLAAGAVCAAPCAFLNFSFFTQAIVWGISSLASLIILRAFVKKKHEQVIKTNIDALIGQEATVINTIEPHHVGNVKVKGEHWPAIAQQGVILHQGTIVTVVDVQGNKLVVR